MRGIVVYATCDVTGFGYNDPLRFANRTPDITQDASHHAPISPTNIAFAPDGGFWVGDGYGSHYIIKYDQDAAVASHFGGIGDGPGQLSTPHGLWWDDREGREPAMVVADRANARLQYFSAEGKHLSFVDDMLFPAAIDLRGDVMLIADLHARIT